MATTEDPFEQALLYLHAAGHDTGAETRVRLQRLILELKANGRRLNTAQLLDKIPQCFELPEPATNQRLPPIARASIGYPDE